MVRLTRRRVLGAAGGTITTALGGCLTGDGEVPADETAQAGETTTAIETATETGTTTETATQTETQTATETATQTETETATQTETDIQTTTDTETTTETETETTTEGALAETVVVGPSGEYRFAPESVTIESGDAVEWTWDSSGHNVVVETQPAAASWEGTDGGARKTYGAGHTHQHTFEVAGTYEYKCAPHQSLGMTGTVVVE